MTAPPRPLRRDAERNRQLLLATARTLMAQRGLHVTHDEVAREAGVGVGTVYRRFPTRKDLVDAVFDQHIDEVVVIGEQASTCDDPWQGLSVFMQRHLAMQAKDRGLSELLRGRGPDSQVVRRARDRITPVVAELVHRARAAGQIGPNVGTDDFFLVQLMVCGVLDDARALDPGHPELWRRALAIALTGLRQHQPLPSDPPTADTAVTADMGGRLHTSSGRAQPGASGAP